MWGLDVVVRPWSVDDVVEPVVVVCFVLAVVLVVPAAVVAVRAVIVVEPARTELVVEPPGETTGRFSVWRSGCGDVSADGPSDGVGGRLPTPGSPTWGTHGARAKLAMSRKR